MTTSPGGRTPAATAVCVFCRRHPAAAEWRPFCSERCKIQDLARWAEGAYRVAGDPPPGPEDSDASEP